ncbi:hypothetical protein EG328_009892 [Venturia inaequalis]|uniref:F-box domain-containing protein n=1 Tax=Venturia inaequalis TaxID=5025 RepID=A0A8H3UDP8_VENIN|nr:hypothetical protein EG328_009892 [Venturia inaequalis]KAE9967708.1 hypothetical protein EG327_011335 [Venturia inaequalis]
MERPKKRVKLTTGNVAYLLDPAVVSAITTIIGAINPPNAAAASIKRASLLGIPTELRLEIFNYLLPNDLPFTIPDTKRLDNISKNWSVDRRHSKRAAIVWSACKNFRSLMLTCQSVSREASEQFYKSAIISFRINHGVYQEGNGSNFGLCGFGAAWSPRSENVRPTPHIESAMHDSLGAFLRNVRFMSLTLDCASIESHRNFGDVSIWSIPARLPYESDSDSSGRNPPRSLSPTGDEAFDKDIWTLVNALKTARFLEKIRFNIEADSGRMESLKVREAIRGIKHLLQPFITLSHISWELKILDFRGPREYPGSGLDIFLDGLEGVKKLDLLHLDSLEEEITTAEEDACEHGREPGYLHYYCRIHIRFDPIRVC